MSSTTTQRPTRSRWPAIALLALLAVGVLLTTLFGLRAIRSFRDFDAHRGRPPREATGDLAPWMTIPYVARAYGVPSEFLFDELGIDPAGNDRKSLMQLGRTYFPEERGVTVEHIRAALELYYAGSTVPTPMPVEPGAVPMPEEGPPRGRDDPDGPPSNAPGLAPPDVEEAP